MAAIKLSKKSNHLRAAYVNVPFQSRPMNKKGRKRTGLKKAYLKSQCGKAILLPRDSHREPKPKSKIVCVKKKCNIKKKFIDKKKCLPFHEHSNKKVRQWLKDNKTYNISSSNELVPQEEQNVKVNSDFDIDFDAKVQASSSREQYNKREDSNETLGPNESEVEYAKEDKNINCDLGTILEEKELHPAVDSLEHTSAKNLANVTNDMENHLMDSLNPALNEPKSEGMALENNFSVPNVSHPPCNTMKEKASRSQPLHRKCFKTNEVARKIAFRKYFLKNSHSGCLMASRKFQKKQLVCASKKRKSSVKIGDVGFTCQNSSLANNGENLVYFDSSLDPNIPLELKVKKKLGSSIFARDPSLCCSTDEEQEPSFHISKEKSAHKFKLSFPGSDMCVDTLCPINPDGRLSSSSQSTTSRIEETEMSSVCSLKKEQKSASSREVCYIFALLDKEKEETIFKTSPQIKSASLLRELGNVINMISANEDISCVRKPVALKRHLGSDLDTPTPKTSDSPRLKDVWTSPPKTPDSPRLKDVWTSPASFEGNTADKSIQYDAQPNSPKDVFPEDNASVLIHDEAVGSKSEEPIVPEQPKVGLKKTTVNSTTKVIVSKALLSFASELNVLTDISIRLLNWCSGTVMGDIDSDSCGDEFEGFLCHCHDKVSIVIECLSELDTKQILNTDEDEINRLWLLHDATCCILQAYRYLHCSSSSDSFNQQLISLMLTCSKMILPRGKVNIEKWMSMMSMVSDICSKLQSSDLLSVSCKCKEYFDSLRVNRFCSVCKLNCLYRDVCNPNKPVSNKNLTEGPNSPNASILEHLFPRFHYFIHEVEGWSEEEFQAALVKHNVVRFSCNVDCGLHPCNEHISVIVCNCFSSSMILDSQFLQRDDALESCNKTNILSKDTHNFCPGQKSSSVHDGDNIRKQQKVEIGHPQKMSHEDGSNCNNHIQGSEVTFTINVDSGRCKSHADDATCTKCSDSALAVSGGESTMSSQDYTLKFGSSSETVENVQPRLLSPVHIHLSGGNGNTNEENLVENSGSSSDKTESTLILRGDSENQKENTDDSPELSCIDYSPLNLLQARRNIEKAISSWGVSSSHVKGLKSQGFVEQRVEKQDMEDISQLSISESLNQGTETDMSESSKQETELSAIQFEDLSREASLCANDGSGTEDADDIVPFQETEENTSSVIVLSSPLHSLNSLKEDTSSEQQNCSKPVFSSMSSSNLKGSYWEDSIDVSDEALMSETKEKRRAMGEIEVDSSQDFEAEPSEISQNTDQARSSLEEQQSESTNEICDSTLCLHDTDTQDSTLDIVSSIEDGNESDCANMESLKSKATTKHTLSNHCCMQVGTKDAVCSDKASHAKCEISQTVEDMKLLRDQHSGGDRDSSNIEEFKKEAGIRSIMKRSKSSVPVEKDEANDECMQVKKNQQKSMLRSINFRKVETEELSAEAPAIDLNTNNVKDSNLRNGILKTSASHPSQATSNGIMGSKGAGRQFKYQAQTVQREKIDAACHTVPSFLVGKNKSKVNCQTEERATKLSHEISETAGQEHDNTHYLKKMKNERLRNTLLSQRKKSIGYEGCESDLEISLDHPNQKTSCCKRSPKKVRFALVDDNNEEPSEEIKEDMTVQRDSEVSACGKQNTTHETKHPRKAKSKQSEDQNSLQKTENNNSSTGDAVLKKVKNSKSSNELTTDSLSKETKSRVQVKEDEQVDLKVKTKTLLSIEERNHNVPDCDNNSNTDAVYNVDDCRNGSCNQEKIRSRSRKHGERCELKHLVSEGQFQVAKVDLEQGVQIHKIKKNQTNSLENLNPESNSANIPMVRDENDSNNTIAKPIKDSKHKDAKVEKKRKSACLIVHEDNVNDVDGAKHKRKKHSKGAKVLDDGYAESQESSKTENIRKGGINNLGVVKPKRKKHSKSENVLQDNMGDGHAESKKGSKTENIREDGINNLDDVKPKRKKTMKSVNEESIRDNMNDTQIQSKESPKDINVQGNVPDCSERAKFKRKKSSKDSNVQEDIQESPEGLKVKKKKRSKIVNSHESVVDISEDVQTKTNKATKAIKQEREIGIGVEKGKGYNKNKV